MSPNISQFYSSHKDETWLALYTGIILISGFFVGGVVGQAFDRYSGFKESIRALINFVPLLNLVTFVSIFVGFYVGLLILLFLDYKKRVQSLIMIGGTIVSFVIVWSQGVLFPWMSPIDYVIVFLISCLTLYFLGGQQLRNISFQESSIWENRRFVTQTNNPLEFPRAAGFLKLTVVLVVVISYFEAYTDYNEPLSAGGKKLSVNIGEAIETFHTVGSETSAAIDLFFSMTLIGAFILFLSYDTGRRVAFIGPPRSGKTHTILGLYSEAQESGYNPRNPSTYLTRRIDDVHRSQDWAPPTQAGEVVDMRFIYTTKGQFSKNVVVDGLDYPGEYSWYIPDGLDLVNDGLALPDEPIDEIPKKVNLGSTTPIGEQLEDLDTETDRWTHLIRNYNSGFEDAYINKIDNSEYRAANNAGGQTSNSSPDQAYLHMVNSVLPRVANADTLVYVFDVNLAKNLMKGDTSNFNGLSFYEEISASADADREFGIATKSDLLKQDFYNQEFQRPLDNPTAFENFVEDELLKTEMSRQLSALQLDLYPIYLETNEDGKPVTPIQPFGTDELLDRLGE